MGKFYHRKQRDGSFSPIISARFKHKGVRVDGSTGATAKKDAEKWVKEQKEKIDLQASQRLLKKSERLTVRQAGDKYWDEHLQFVGSADRSEKYRLGKTVGEIGPDLPLEELSTAHLKTVIAAKRSGGSIRGGKETARKVTVGTINRDMRPIKAMHNMARDVWEYPGLKAIAWTKLLVKGPTRVIKPPTVEEVRALVAVATPRLARVIMFAALTGLRLDEIRNLSWNNLALGDVPGPTMTVIGKGDKEAILPLSSAATSLLSSMPREQSSRVFDLTNFQREWVAARKAAGLPRTRFHDLRHAFATLFRATLKETHGAVDPMAIKDALRHSDIATSSIYAHADSQEMLPSLDAVAARLIGSPEKLQTLLPASEQPDDVPSITQSGEAA